MNPIATYTEQRFDGKRTFRLFEDKVVVHGKATMKADFESTIPLAAIDPKFATLRLRHSAFFGGMWLALGSWALAFIVGSISQKDPFVVVGFLGFMGFVGVILMLATARKVEWIRFGTDAGVVVLDIARAGKEKDKLDDFVEALISQITTARRRAEPDAPPNSRPPSQPPSSPEVQTPDSLRTPSSGGCG